MTKKKNTLTEKKPLIFIVINYHILGDKKPQQQVQRQPCGFSMDMLSRDCFANRYHYSVRSTVYRRSWSTRLIRACTCRGIQE